MEEETQTRKDLTGPRAPTLLVPPPGLPEFVIGGTGRISGRGVAAMPEGDPRPWWPIAVHRVRVTPPVGEAFEDDASVEVALIRSGVEKMALLFRHAPQEALVQGSRVISLGFTPHPARPAAQTDKGAAPRRRWWQFWR